MATIGYARVSTREQNTDAQEAELRAAGAQRVFIDHDVFVGYGRVGPLMRRARPITMRVRVFVPIIRRVPRVVMMRMQATMMSRAPVAHVSDLYALSSGLWAAR